MERFYGLIELMLVFGLLGWFYWSQKRALRRMRAEDERAEQERAQEERAQEERAAAAATEDEKTGP